MKYDFGVTDDFEKEFKSLFKKYPSLKEDLKSLQKDIIENPNLGTDLGSGFKKIRMDIKSKNKGKAGGGRVITYEAIININSALITFVSIYNKGQHDTIDIAILKKNLGI